MNDFIVIYVTAPNFDMAKNIASQLVENRLAACANIIPSINSIYRWEGKICDDQEVLIIIKTRAELFSRLEEKVKSIHSYSVPEIIALPILEGSTNYLNWIKEETT